MTIVALHKLAYARMPKALVHDRLHDMAIALGDNISSLCDCTPAQLDEIGAHVRLLPLTEVPARRSSAYGPRDRWSHRANDHDETLKRPRTGTTSGAIKLASRAQKQLISNLASEIGWTDEALSKWLQRQFEVATIEQIGKSQTANEAIKRLMHIKAQRRQEAVR